MTHPHHLHALAAAASLRVALVTLGRRAAAERYGAAAAGDGLHSPSWAPTRGSGGHTDPVAAAVTSTVRSAGERRARWTYATLAWLATKLGLPAEAPLDAIEYNLPRLRPSTAWQVCLWLRDLDDRCRNDVGLDGGLVGLNGVPCPACGKACVYRNAAGLHECLAALCLCAGDACPCTMPVKAAGAQHIWAPKPIVAENMPENMPARHPDKVKGLRPQGFYLDEAAYPWDGQ